jgi:uncharacterized protein YjgD (DUF1641 family)
MTITEAPVDRVEALEAKIDLLTEQIAVLTADVEYRRRQREVFDAVAEFVDDAAPLGTDVMAVLTDRLAEAEQKGYFTMATAAIRVADRVVTNFDEHDVEALGENVVAMLEALRDVTQPEMLAFLGRMLDAVEAEQAAVASESVDPPSLWALARQVRDPEIRRGMARALHTLRAVSVETGPASNRGDIK